MKAQIFHLHDSWMFGQRAKRPFFCSSFHGNMFLWLLWAPARDMAFSEEAFVRTLGQFHQEPEQKVEEISCFEETSDVIVVDIWLMWCDKKAALAAYSARVAFEAKSASAIFPRKRKQCTGALCSLKKKWEQLQCVGWSTWSPGHVLMSRWVSWGPNTFTLNHSDAFGIIWQCPRMDMRGHDTMERESSLRLLAEAILDYLRVVFQFQSGSNLRRLPRKHPGRIGGIVWHWLTSAFIMKITAFKLLNIYFMIKNVTISILIWIWYGSPTSIWRLGLHDRRQWAPQRLSASETPMATPIGTNGARASRSEKWHGSMWWSCVKITQKNTFFLGMRDGWWGLKRLKWWKTQWKNQKDIKYKPCNDYFKTCLLAKASQLDWQQTREGTEAIWGSNLQEPRPRSLF